VIGETKMEVTHETIVAAVQLYLDGQFAAGKAPIVERVSFESSSKNSYSTSSAFVVTCKAPALPAPAGT